MLHLAINSLMNPPTQRTNRTYWINQQQRLQISSIYTAWKFVFYHLCFLNVYQVQNVSTVSFCTFCQIIANTVFSHTSSYQWTHLPKVNTCSKQTIDMMLIFQKFMWYCVTCLQEKSTSLSLYVNCIWKSLSSILVLIWLDIKLVLKSVHHMEPPYWPVSRAQSN